MELFDYLPGYYSQSTEMKACQQALGAEVGKAWEAYFSMLDQLFVDTATHGLDLWERALGLETDREKSYEYRRTRVISKLRGQGTTTKDMLKNVASSFSGGKTEIVESPGKYRFDVEFIDVIGTPPNMEDLTAAIEEIKPAHLAFGYLYRYLLIKEVHQVMTISEIQQTKLNKFAGGNNGQ